MYRCTYIHLFRYIHVLLYTKSVYRFGQYSVIFADYNGDPACMTSTPYDNDNLCLHLWGLWSPELYIATPHSSRVCWRAHTETLQTSTPYDNNNLCLHLWGLLSPELLRPLTASGGFVTWVLESTHNSGSDYDSFLQSRFCRDPFSRTYRLQ